MAATRLFGVFFCGILATQGTARAAGDCDLDAYMKVVAACYTGRADGFGLPANEAFSTYDGIYTSQWNKGAYDATYNGTAFTPAGETADGSASIMPPYNWGGVGQMCDQTFDPATHAACEQGIRAKLVDPELNARYASGGFYWLSHGHNCHDAAEDVGTCLNNAAAVMPASCDLAARIVVWDSEPDVNKALGDVYHSEILVKKIRKNPTTHTQEPVVCLTESQAKTPGGLIEDS